MTFDDLPAIQMPPSSACNLESIEKMTERLLAKVTASRVPALGLVVESRLCDELRTRHLAPLLERWLDAGLELGNHSYSHFDLNQTPPKQYREDIVRGEATTSRLLADRGKKLRYFRYPFLHRNADRFDALAEMMTGRGYSYISLEQALSDEAYRSPDTYIGPQGLSWLLRWAKAADVQVPKEPREPQWLTELFRTY